MEEEQRKTHVSVVTAFLYLFLSLGSLRDPGFIYTLRSTIPIGAGLGSSASVSVYLSAALLLQQETLERPQAGQPVNEAKEQIERISRWAYIGELCIHGTPSGVDNAVSSRGGAMMFRKDHNNPPSMIPLSEFPKLNVLIVDTKQKRSTAAQLEKVRKLMDDEPTVIESAMDTIGHIAESAEDILIFI